MGLRESIEDRSAIVGIIGMGYVGLPLALQAGSAGFKVVGLEKDGEKRERLARGDALYEGLDGETLKGLLAAAGSRSAGTPAPSLPAMLSAYAYPPPSPRHATPTWALSARRRCR